MNVICSQRAAWKRLPITFVFDGSEKPKWTNAVTAAFRAFNGSHPRSWLVWGNKDCPENLPLQAADMVAYRSRLATADWADRNLRNFWPELDSVLFKPIFDWMTANKEMMLPYLFSKEMYRYDTYE